MSGWAAMSVVVLAGLGAYMARCWWYPYAKCACCKGTGRHEAKNGKVLRRCHFCKGSGRRRRVWQMLLGLRKETP